MRLAWLLLVLLLVPAAAGQGIQLIADGETVFVHGGDTASAELLLISDDTSQSFQVRLEARDPAGNWQVRLVPDQTILAPGEERIVRVEVTGADQPTPHSFVARLEAFGVAEDFSTASAEAEVEVQATGTNTIMGRWENTLPAPLDQPVGTFAINLAVWWGIGLVTMWLISPTLKLLTLRTKTDLDDKIIQIIGRPAFILVFTFGVVQSLEVFALPVWVFGTLRGIWTMVLGVAVIYVAYKLWHGIVLALGKRLARRTESELDDRLYPVMEKVGGILIVAIGGFYLLTSFGIDLTLFAAGGAIGGLVIAFAAQDTLANFFAGIFILMDRPFRVGDRIELPEQQHWGDVQRIGLRTTSVRTQDNRMVIFPNNYIGSNPIVNHSYPDQFYRIQVDFRLPYGSDVEFIRKTLVEAVIPVEGVNADRSPEALLLEFTEHGQGWRLRWWIQSYVDTRRMFDRVNSAVIKAMAAANIRIQYQPLTLWDAHKLMERDSQGGLAPSQLTDAERAKLEHEAEASRKEHEQVEAKEIEDLKAKEKAKRARRDEEE